PPLRIKNKQQIFFVFLTQYNIKMNSGINLKMTALAVATTAFLSASAQTTSVKIGSSSPDVTEIINQMAVVKASRVGTPPDWSIMQRQLISVTEQAAPYYLKRFTRPDGTTYGKGPYDDVYEMFYNWPELYAISGNEFLYNTA